MCFEIISQENIKSIYTIFLIFKEILRQFFFNIQYFLSFAFRKYLIDYGAVDIIIMKKKILITDYFFFLKAYFQSKNKTFVNDLALITFVA